MSAFACNPCCGSEHGVGWGWVNAIAANHEAWVLTAEFERADIEKAVAADPARYASIRFHYLPFHCPRWLDRLWPPSWLWRYRLWQRAAYRLGRKLHEEVGFDLVHLVTYVGFRVPGHLWKLDVPFVWGPIGGLENTPWRLLPLLGVRGAIYYAARNIVNSLHRRFLRLPRRAFAKAAATGTIIAATEGIRREIRRWYGHDSEVICEIGTPDEVAADHSVRRPGEPLRLAWSGRHDAGKALHLLLKAVAMLPAEVDWRLDILGEGPCTKRWRRLAVKLAVDARCTWHGWLPRDKAIGLIHDSHVFVITSLKDLTSTVLLEALSQGVPVLCLDHCGFSDVVTEECGIKLAIDQPGSLPRSLMQAIQAVWADEGHRRGMALSALQRAISYSWQGKERQICRVYDQSLPRKVAHPHVSGVRREDLQRA
ncbi:MAG: glycosyltransferase family 4 protein [Phycisphaerae bacterium]